MRRKRTTLLAGLAVQFAACPTLATQAASAPTTQRSNGPAAADGKRGPSLKAVCHIASVHVRRGGLSVRFRPAVGEIVVLMPAPTFRVVVYPAPVRELLMPFGASAKRRQVGSDACRIDAVREKERVGVIVGDTITDYVGKTWGTHEFVPAIPRHRAPRKR